MTSEEIVAAEKEKIQRVVDAAIDRMSRSKGPRGRSVRYNESLKMYEILDAAGNVWAVMGLEAMREFTHVEH